MLPEEHVGYTVACATQHDGMLARDCPWFLDGGIGGRTCISSANVKHSASTLCHSSVHIVHFAHLTPK